MEIGSRGVRRQPRIPGIRAISGLREKVREFRGFAKAPACGDGKFDIFSQFGGLAGPQSLVVILESPKFG
jgi:hypothetical protein